jgi:ASPIC and UnbV.
VTITLAGGRTFSQEVRAGSSYLSSEDPRVHFGLGPATTVARLSVRYPWGGECPPQPARRPDRRGFRPAAATATGVGARFVPAPGLHGGDPRPLDRDHLDGDGGGRAPAPAPRAEPVQAHDVFDVSAAMWDAWAAYDPAANGYFTDAKASAPDVASARNAAISYAAYRVLLWQASFDANLGRRLPC